MQEERSDLANDSQPAGEPAPQTQVFIAKFPRSTTEDDFREYFKIFGNITEVNIKKGFAFVNFATEGEALRAVEGSKDAKINSSHVVVEIADQKRRPRRERESRTRRTDENPRTKECWHCGKKGHMSADCWHKKTDFKASSRRDKRKGRRKHSRSYSGSRSRSSSTSSSSSGSRSRERHRSRDRLKKSDRHKGDRYRDTRGGGRRKDDSIPDGRHVDRRREHKREREHSRSRRHKRDYSRERRRKSKGDSRSRSRDRSRKGSGSRNQSRASSPKSPRNEKETEEKGGKWEEGPERRRTPSPKKTSKKERNRDREPDTKSKRWE